MNPSSSPHLHIDPNTPVNGVCERESDHQGVTLKYLRYFSHTIGDFPLEMAAILAFPKTPGPHPALLHLHGGAQCANAGIALAWAERGYVTLCPDWSVPANMHQSAHATRWPDNTPPAHESLLEAEDATIGHVVRGVRHGISLLAALPEVQADRIGMVGISWGGLMTWLVNGTDTRLRTAIALYGSGRTAGHPMSESWRKNFQPESVAAAQHAPILHLNGTHDFFGHLETSEALLKKVGPKARRFYVPNEDHGLNESARQCAWAWLDLHLRGDGQLPPEPDAHPTPGKRFFHARSMDRSAVWRELPAGPLPEAGCGYITETHPNGLAFSSPVYKGPPQATHASPVLWDHKTQGLDGFYLRWEQENLAVHTPAKARLQLNEHGVGFTPAVNSFRVFLRCEAAPDLPQAHLRVTLFAPKGTRVQLRGYPQPEIEETSVREFEDQRCEQDGIQTLVFRPKSSCIPTDLKVLHLALTPSDATTPELYLQRVEWG